MPFEAIICNGIGPPAGYDIFISEEHNMKEFTYAVNDPLGIHARPAGLLAKLAKTFADTTVTITKGEKTVKATQLMMLMSLAVKNGESVTVKAEGPAEDAAIEAMEKFFKENL